VGSTAMRHLAPAVALALILGACGDDGAATTEPATTSPATTTPGPPLTIDLDGAAWEIPSAACLVHFGDAEAVADIASAAATEVEAAVADRSSGWPTTTRPPEGDEAFEAIVHSEGILSLALGGIAGTDREIEDRWDAFEQRYADPDQGFGAVTAITERIDDWRTEAALLRAAIDQACSA